VFIVECSSEDVLDEGLDVLHPDDLVAVVFHSDNLGTKKCKINL
jgi:hypothetical protein